MRCVVGPTHGLEDGEAHAAEHSRLDRGARDLAVALGCVAIAAGEERAGDGDGEEGGAADAEVAVVHVAALRFVQAPGSIRGS